MPRKALNQFAHPGPDEFDYQSMLEVMKACREHVQRFYRACGLRNPAHGEARALIEQIDAVARLSRVQGAEQFVAPPIVGHSTPGR